MSVIFELLSEAGQALSARNPLKSDSQKIADWAAEATDTAFENIRGLAGRHPELVPQAIEVLIQNGNRKALRQIGNLVVEGDNSEHIPLVIEKGCAAGTEEAVATVCWMARRFPQYAPLVIRTLKTLKMPGIPGLIADLIIDNDNEMNPSLHTADLLSEDHGAAMEAIAALHEIGTDDATSYLYQIALAYSSFARRTKDDLAELINFHVPQGEISGEEIDRRVADQLDLMDGKLSGTKITKTEIIKYVRDQRAQALAYVSEIMNVCQAIGNRYASANLELLAHWDPDLLPRAVDLLRTFRDHVAAWDLSMLAYQYPKNTALAAVACTELLDMKASGHINKDQIPDDTFSGQLRGVVKILAEPVNLLAVAREGDAQKIMDLRAVLARLENEAGQWEKGALTSTFASAEELTARSAKAFPRVERKGDGPSAPAVS